MLIQVPLRLIKRHGRQVTYKKIQEGTYDPNTSSYSDAGEVTYTVDAYSTKTSYSDSMSPSVVGEESRTYIMAGIDVNFKPDAGDFIVDGSDEYQVKMVRAHEAHGIVAMWSVVVV